MALGAQPQHIPATAERLLRSADDLWWLAGDTSTDLHWYSRRLLLVSVIVASELHLLTDASAGHAETWAFIERRVADVALFGRGAGEMLSVGQEAAAGVGSIITAAASLVQPLPGFFSSQVLGRGSSASRRPSDAAAPFSPDTTTADGRPFASAAAPLAAASAVASAIGSSAPAAAAAAALKATAPQLMPGSGGPLDAVAKSVLPPPLAAAGDAILRGLFGIGNSTSSSADAKEPVAAAHNNASDTLQSAAAVPLEAATTAARTIGSSGPGAAVSAALRAAAPQLIPGTGGPIDAAAKSILPAPVASAGEAVVHGLFGRVARR
jgi:hypothetical protein